MKSTPVLDALCIGFMIGIIVYSAANNTIGLVTLIPLGFIYMMINRPKASADVENSSDEDPMA